jgi:ankyrin repeat protein
MNHLYLFIFSLYKFINFSCNAISRYTKYNHIDDSTLDFFDSITNHFSLSNHGQNGCSALHVASKNGHLEVLKCLLEKDASIIHDRDYVRYSSSIQSYRFDYSLYFLCFI